jgi:hypothetical protein
MKLSKSERKPIWDDILFDGRQHWKADVKDDAQFAIWRNGTAIRFCVTVKALRRDWRELTGTEIPTDHDPFLGATNIKEYLALASVFDKLEGK